MYDAAHERSYWYESILNTIPFGISVTDMDMRWTFCNKAALESMNKTAAECLGRPCLRKERQSLQYTELRHRAAAQGHFSSLPMYSPPQDHAA